MSKTIMWEQSTADGCASECLFNEDNRTYEVVVSGREPGRSRSASFPVRSEPVWGMDEADHRRSQRLAETLVAEIAGAAVPAPLSPR